MVANAKKADAIKRKPTISAKKTSKSNFRVIDSDKGNSRGLTAKSLTEQPRTDVSAEETSIDVVVAETISPSIVSKKMATFLKQNNFLDEARADDIGPALDQFIRDEVPEIEAIQKLRYMATAKPDVPKYVAAQHGDTMKFYEMYFQQSVIDGKLDLPSITRWDSNFVRNFNRKNEIALGDIIAQDTKSPTSARYEIFSTLLGDTSEDVVRSAMIAPGSGSPRR